MITRELQPTAYTANQTFVLDPNYEHTLTLNGSGTWQYWDGTAYADFAESTGTSQGFIAVPPPTGKVQLAVTSGTVTAGFHRFLPRAINTKGR